jgi:hypothetical protein
LDNRKIYFTIIWLWWSLLVQKPKIGTNIELFREWSKKMVLPTPIAPKYLKRVTIVIIFAKLFPLAEYGVVILYNENFHN